MIWGGAQGTTLGLQYTVLLSQFLITDLRSACSIFCYFIAAVQELSLPVVK